MPRLDPVRPEAASAPVRDMLEATRKPLGHGFNTIDTLGANAEILGLFMAFQKHLPNAGLTPPEREVAAVEIARFNNCHYCMPAHRYIGRKVGVAETELARASEGAPLEDPALALVQRAVRRLLETKGALEDAELAEFRAAGLDDARMLALIGECALYTMMNFTNRLAQTELDPFLADQ